MSILICGVGGRDLMLDGQAAADRGTSQRSFGADVLNRHEQIGDSLTLPIIAPLLDRLRATGNLPRIVRLLVSDQREGVAKRETDTCVTGEVLQTLVKVRYGIDNIKLLRMQSDPSDYEAVEHYLDRAVPSLEKGQDRMDLEITGGTPAMSWGLMSVAMRANCPEVFIWSVPHDGAPKPLAVVAEARAAQRRNDLLAAIAHRRFGAAVALLPEDSEQLGLEPRRLRALRKACQAAAARLAFDLETARRLTAEALEEPGLSESVREQLEDSLASLPMQEDAPGLLAELAHNACEKLNHGEYADFVLRLFNFQQSALRLALVGAGVAFERDGEFVSRAWLDANAGFLDFAQDHEIEMDTRRATAYVLLRLADYLGPMGRIDTRVAELGGCLQKLAELRNRSFAAHDFRAVSRETLAAAFGEKPERIPDSMAKLYGAATGTGLPSQSPLDAAAAACEFLVRSRY